MNRPLGASYGGPLIVAALHGAFAMTACTAGDHADDPIVARAFDQTLHWSDLRAVVPMGVEEHDSAAIADRYIANWLREQVIIHQAEANLAEGQKDFEARLQEYRRGLLIYAYEEALVRQQLDTVVTMAEIQAYYDSNQADFALGEAIVRCSWARVKEDDRRTRRRLEEWFLSGDPTRMGELERWLAEHGQGFNDEGNTWVPLSVLAARTPAGPWMEGLEVVNGRKVYNNEGGTWFVDILEHRPRNTPAPIELVSGDIRAIIINKRKLRLIANMREDLYRHAVDNKDVQVL